MIAQDIQKVYPQVVRQDPKTGLLSVTYDHLVAPLVDAVKAIYNKVTTHDREIASLKAKVAKQDGKLRRLQSEVDQLKKLIKKTN